eukprot:scaffold104545_cov69-Phaeocystis_antarctica.AAC.6
MQSRSERASVETGTKKEGPILGTEDARSSAQNLTKSGAAQELPEQRPRLPSTIALTHTLGCASSARGRLYGRLGAVDNRGFMGVYAWGAVRICPIFRSAFELRQRDRPSLRVGWR